MAEKDITKEDTLLTGVSHVDIRRVHGAPSAHHLAKSFQLPPDTPNDELTIIARAREWDIFTPDWEYIAQIPVLELGSLCALSVGLHPYFADPGWARFIATPFFAGEWDDEFCPLEYAGVGRNRAAFLNDFIRRVHIAAANLAPRGALPIADGEAAGERTLIRASDFVAWAKGQGWALPTELHEAFGMGEQASTMPEPAAPSHEAAPPDYTDRSKTKSEKQISAILHWISVKHWNPLQIPDGGCGTLQSMCEKSEETAALFDFDTSFDNAWRKARKKRIVEMANHASFTRRGV